MRCLAAVAVVLVGTVQATIEAPAGDTVCARFAPVEVGGTVAEPRLIELSGMAGSRQHSDVVWAHNDSGGAPELYGFAEDGTSLGTYPVEGAGAIDWEDMATGPTPDGVNTALYVGDIGDNDAARESVTVYRVFEPGEIPVAPGVPLTDVEAIELRYPDGPSDAEALLIDPLTGDLVIVTKSLFGASRVLTAPAAQLEAGEPVTLVDAGPVQVPLPPDPGPGLPGTPVTGGDVSPDGSIVLLRTYRSVLAFERLDGQSLAEALLGDPCFAPQVEEEQGEAIAFTGDGTAYLTASEGANPVIQRVDIAAPAPTTTTAPATTTTAPPAPEDGTEESSSGTVVIGVIGLVVLAAAAGLWLRRSRASRPG